MNIPSHLVQGHLEPLHNLLVLHHSLHQLDKQDEQKIKIHQNPLNTWTTLSVAAIASNASRFFVMDLLIWVASLK